MELKREFEDLKCSVTAQGQDLDDLKLNSVTFNDKEIESVKQSLKKFKDENKEFKDKLSTTNNSECNLREA